MIRNAQGTGHSAVWLLGETGNDNTGWMWFIHPESILSFFLSHLLIHHFLAKRYFNFLFGVWCLLQACFAENLEDKCTYLVVVDNQCHTWLTVLHSVRLHCLLFQASFQAILWEDMLVLAPICSWSVSLKCRWTEKEMCLASTSPSNKQNFIRLLLPLVECIQGTGSSTIKLILKVRRGTFKA